MHGETLWVAVGGRQARSLNMQATAALVEAGPERETVPVEWLPDEVLELLFRFADPKTLLMVVPAVSARAGRQRGDTQLSVRVCAWGRCPPRGASVLDWRGRF